MSETNFTEVVQNLADKTLAQLSDLFRQLMESEERMQLSKEAESIKSSFYKLLNKFKAEAGEATSEAAEKLDVVEENFKAVYADYKRERAEFNRKLEEEKEENLAKKQAVIEDLKALLENSEEVNFPAFREIQDRWRAIGQVPAANFRDLNDTYQYNVERFYDMVKINRDLRDLDFKKNLEAKEAFCEAAEKLAENENVVSAFNELQKLHEQWKDLGPVAKEFRDSIWDRFKAATAVINKKYQAHFEEMKELQAGNLEAKAHLCELVEEIAAKEDIQSAQWNELSKRIEEIQAEWRTIGFATKKDNQKIYDRFRAACDKFYERKREHFAEFKGEMNEKIQKKEDLIRMVEELKTSTEWKKTSEKIIDLQKQWKEIGNVPRKKGELLWTRFRAACDEFFAERDKNAKPENDFYGNLRAKKKLVEEINAYELSSSEVVNAAAQKEFADRWAAIGFVPFKEKDAINAAYRDAIAAKFPRKGRSVKDELIKKFNALQQDISTYENNIGFFSASRNSAPIIAQMKERIEVAKAELKSLEEKIRKSEEDGE